MNIHETYKKILEKALFDAEKETLELIIGHKIDIKDSTIKKKIQDRVDLRIKILEKKVISGHVDQVINDFSYINVEAR